MMHKQIPPKNNILWQNTDINYSEFKIGLDESFSK